MITVEHLSNRGRPPSYGTSRAAITVMLLVMAAVGSSVGATRADPGAAVCSPMMVAVTGGHVSATLCAPTAPTDTVVLLQPGASGSQWYWNATGPDVAEYYSFTRAMNAAGFATMVIDRLGTGNSTRPPSWTLTASTAAQNILEVADDLRQGHLGASPYRKVVVGGVSLSAGTALMAAATDTAKRIDGLLLTGFSHSPSYPDAIAIAADSFRPAALVDSARFAGYDLGYLTTTPGSRAKAFFAADTDPAVLAGDEENKDVFSPTEFVTAMTSTVLPMAERVHVPVLVANGAQDRLCAAVCASSDILHAAEAPWYQPESQLQTFVLPDSGHAINLARTTAAYQAAVRDWITSVVRS
ncbi:alpha/beta hydrolase [Nocardia sp. CDC159]|uniref:Alpha/beta hydrolase n=1 Tax=Nocardia pulmonis TaxID=2951408 RepID=A0A9X2E6A5_9NOCA|nr:MULTISPECIES: alpha/beta hydrolase [Nocardia]MCM6774441.1 alpha/beta hydrolase [Nocardia pulmonis]MCM6787493.1 alpha/beta hydrolase [Nocardia sp. CDC159]